MSKKYHIAMTGVFTSLISCFINASPNKKLVGYSYLEQMKDILPSLLIAAVMFGAVLCVELLRLDNLVTMVVQVAVGVVVYIGLAALLRLEPFRFLLNLLKKKLKK